jgi:hypothetical protein
VRSRGKVGGRYGGRWLKRGRRRRSEKHDTMQLSDDPTDSHVQAKQAALYGRKAHLNDFRRSFDRLQITEEDDDVYLVL